MEDAYKFWVKGQLMILTFQHIGSDTITSVGFDIHFSYFIHRCRMVRRRYLYILRSGGSKFKSYCLSHPRRGPF